jgi:hypothetical protein
MSVVEFRHVERGRQGWQVEEVNAVVGACATAIARGEASAYHIGITEMGDPQLYVLGPAPEQPCILSVSRLGRLYVLEDGGGNVLLEHSSMPVVAREIRASLTRKRADIVARVTVAWCAVREFFEEKVEPVLAEPVEILTHVAPQLAAMV